MRTSEPIQALIPKLLSHIKKFEPTTNINKALIDICNGNLLPYVEAAMKKELNPRAFERSRKRIPPINILKKLQTKLNKVYAEVPTRKAGENSIDNDLLSLYETNWNINDQLTYINELLVINKYAALEPYMTEGEEELRVLDASKFLVYSDSSVNPNEMTVFIKFMGTKVKESKSDTHLVNIASEGSKSAQIREVPLYHAYSDDEFIIFDGDGETHALYANPYGAIPFIYIRTNPNELIPTPDSDNLPMVTLIPQLLTDLNYSVMFGCRSQVVAIDVELDNVEFSPDSMWILNSVPGENKSPSLDTIKSDVDVEKVLELINSQLGLWLDTKGIKSGSIGQATIKNSASGISKLIDESDATAVNRRYKKTFQTTEKKLWKLLPKLHRVWINNGESEQTVDFSQAFKPSTKFIDSKVLPNIKDILEELKLKKELGLFILEEAMAELYPELTPTELELLIAKIDNNEINLILKTDEQE